ncbi:DUF1858 domain-containing protein [Microvirga flocculans]
MTDPILIDVAQRPLSCRWHDYFYVERRMEGAMPVEATQLVDDVMRRWPATIRVFLNHKMHCVGCPITCFHTVADACREHNVNQTGFLAELNAMIGQKAPSSGEGQPGATAIC